MQGNVATKIQQLVQNLVEEDLATRIHQYFEGVCVLTFTQCEWIITICLVIIVSKVMFPSL